jgi:perosamine synthetase
VISWLLSKNHPWHTAADLTRVLLANFGDDVSAFENSFAESVGAPYGIAFPYCRSAIHLALEVGTPIGSSVVLTDYTCIVIPHAIILANRTPRFADIDGEDLNSSVKALHARMAENTRAILVTHMVGNRVDLSSVETGINQPTLLIEDSALSLHNAYRPKGKWLKAVSAYSFDFNKHFSAISGGMLVTHDEELARNLRDARNKTLRMASAGERTAYLFRFLGHLLLYQPTLYACFDRVRKIPAVSAQVEYRGDFNTPSFPSDANVHMTSAQACLGLAQIERKQRILDRRLYWARRYQDALWSEPSIQLLPFLEDSHYSHFTIRVPHRDERKFRERLKARGIEGGRTLDYTTSDFTYYRKFSDCDFPLASRAAREVVNLPNYPSLTEGQFQRVVAAVHKTANEGTYAIATEQHSSLG